MLRFLSLPLCLVVSARADLVATFSQGGVTDARLDRMAALSVPAGQAPTPFLEAGKFEAEWKGSIELKERKRLCFSFEGNGKAVLTVAGEEVLAEEGTLGAAKTKRLRLNPGLHEIRVSYGSPEDGSGSFRLYWEEEGMPRQTVPPAAFAAEATDDAKLGELRRHGRMAFTQQHCAKCHAPEGGFGASPMPETGEIAPILAGIGDRVAESWLRDWIADPKAMKPGTKMPNLVDPGTPEGLQKAADLAAFLAASKFGAPAPPVPDPSLSKAGGAVFHELGCVGCHDQSGADASRVPLNNVASKYLPGQLAAFLKKPEAFHPFTAMPNFKLTDDEAASLAAYLTASSEGKGTVLGYRFPAGDATRGAEVAASLHCGTCHPGLPGGVPSAPALEKVFAADWAEKGCVSEKDKRPALPKMNLGEGDREGLLAFSKAGIGSLKRDSASEFAERQVSSKNCTACHAMDGKASGLESLHSTTSGLAAHVKGLNERVDQSRPPLTFVGEMLFSSYVESMLAGTVVERPRPWLGTRMPAFPAYAKTMADGLSRAHGFEPGPPVKVEVDPALAGIGKKLVSAEGFGCTTCHGIGGQAPTAAFEVGAVNFALTPGRLREEFYHRWMDNPAGVTPGSKMPRYADGNESQRTDILEGDARKQYEAIWHWLHSEQR
jgi:mono/diheme cytochrome c family protein